MSVIILEGAERFGEAGEQERECSGREWSFSVVVTDTYLRS